MAVQIKSLPRRYLALSLTTHAELGADGKQLRVVTLGDKTTERVRALCTSPDELRAGWANATINRPSRRRQAPPTVNLLQSLLYSA